MYAINCKTKKSDREITLDTQLKIALTVKVAPYSIAARPLMIRARFSKISFRQQSKIKQK